MKKHFFVVIEGIDNSGKTTLLKLIKKQLEEPENSLIRNYFGEKIYFTSEPYGPNQEIKYFRLSDLIFSQDCIFSSESETYLFLAMRADHLSSFIVPKLQENSLIFCDRYFLSTLAYQSYLKKVDTNWLVSNMKHISKGIKPLVTFVLEVSKENHLSYKTKKNGKSHNEYDSVNSFSYEDLVTAYDWAVKYLRDTGEEVVWIPSSLSWEEKAQTVISYIKKSLDE